VLPDRPAFFTKPTTAVVGPTSSIQYDALVTEQLDFEAELAVVIGRGGRGIAEEHALEHVFGYMLANDVSARDLQRRHGGQWFKGKALDSSCPTGPWIVTADEIDDPQALRITCEVNGSLMQDGRTMEMIFPITRLIAELSHGMTLLPGDILLTGTPDGVGAFRVPPRFLIPGDRIKIGCSAIGIIENEVVSADLHSEIDGAQARLLQGDCSPF
jgi:2-keto-4-pentenoate hydratase/2-oxohepta-3-ene-1,7-dioic acid hydratase in catechol pathway